MSTTDTTTPTITGLDFVTIPTQDPDRAARFYGEVLGLRKDDKADYEFWAGSTCLAIWAPEQVGRPFIPQKGAHLALHVDDIGAARAALEARGVTFAGDTFDTGVCHMAMFSDLDGNDLMLHSRHTPRT